MRAAVATLTGGGTIGWLIIALISRHGLALGAIALHVLALALGFTVLVVSGTEIVPGGRSLERREVRMLVALMVMTAALGVLALALAVASSPATNAVAALGTLVSAALFGYAARSLTRVPQH